MFYLPGSEGGGGRLDASADLDEPLACLFFAFCALELIIPEKENNKKGNKQIA